MTRITFLRATISLIALLGLPRAHGQDNLANWKAFVAAVKDGKMTADMVRPYEGLKTEDRGTVGSQLLFPGTTFRHSALKRQRAACWWKAMTRRTRPVRLPSAIAFGRRRLEVIPLFRGG